jgi:hypothetical protein
MTLNEYLQVVAFVEKLLSSWKDLKNYIMHKLKKIRV